MQTSPRGTVSVECFSTSFTGFRPGAAVVVVDVIRATTTAVTALERGYRCYPVNGLERAFQVAATLDRPLLCGEVAGEQPAGFDLSNSPARVALMADAPRPIVLLSSTGTQLLCEAAEHTPWVYAACLRNYSALVAYLLEHHTDIAIVGAGSRGEFREEDQLGCALVAAGLMRAGYSATPLAEDVVARWSEAPIHEAAEGKSARYLINSGQHDDLDFIFSHVDDLDTISTMCNGELVTLQAGALAAASLPMLPLLEPAAL